MARFTSFEDWEEDRFDGSYDGRPARLSIMVNRAAWDPGRYTISLFFEDDRGEEWSSRPEIRDYAADDRAISDLTLHPPPGSDRPPLEWPRLFIHTWDIDFLSGVARRNGAEHGMCWTRNPRRG